MPALDAVRMRLATGFAVMMVFVVLALSLTQLDTVRASISGVDSGLSAFISRVPVVYLFVVGSLLIGGVVAFAVYVPPRIGR